MKLRKMLSAVLSATLLFAGCSTQAPEPEAQQPEKEARQALPADRKYSVLFIGNSYTFYNSMPVLFRSVASAAGYEVETKDVTKGGYHLWQHLYKEEDRAKLDAKLLGETQYDFVILQEHSTGALDKDQPLFYRGVRELDSMIRGTGATPVLYSTWGRKTGHSVLEKNGWTNESMTWDIARAYKTIGEELDIPVAHVGLAFYDVYTGNGNIELYDEDKTHPSYEGSCLAALTLFAEIFGVDPTTFEYNGGLAPEVGAALREAARKAVFETPAITKA